MKVKCKTYTKIVGYCRPVDNWNVGKKQEFKDRKFLSMKGSSM
jgi:ribonucleoside-triphosphate reductase